MLDRDLIAWQQDGSIVIDGKVFRRVFQVLLADTDHVWGDVHGPFGQDNAQVGGVGVCRVHQVVACCEDDIVFDAGNVDEERRAIFFDCK